MNKKVMVMGDLHGEWGKANILINKEKDRIDRILQCGDFGYWPNFHNKTEINQFGIRKTYNNYGLKTQGIEMNFCDGNHENHDELQYEDPKLDEINVVHRQRGETIKLKDGRTVLFMGGAASIDRQARVAGYDWFMGETINEKDMYNLPDEKVDIVISHTCPLEFDPFSHSDNKGYKMLDPTRARLTYILRKYKPSLWFFGHFHRYSSGFDHDCKWYCLDECYGDTRWWMWLPD